MRTGALVGLLSPSIVLLPMTLAGNLATRLADGGAYALLPFFALSAVPAAMVGAWDAANRPGQHRLKLLSLGALAGGWLMGSAVLFSSYGHVSVGRQLLLSVSGGPALVGFWTFAGVWLGAWFVNQRRAKETGRRPAA